MNWIIIKSKKLSSHTYLNEIFVPILGEVINYNWILSDIEYSMSHTELPINMDDDYFVLSPDEFQTLLDADVQIWWGSVLAVPTNVKISIDQNNIPYTEGNKLIWTNDNIQYPEAEIEIDCVDSSYTIVKFKNKELSDKFRDYFPEAIELEKFK